MTTYDFPVKRWRKLPVSIEAMQYDGTELCALAICAWCPDASWISDDHDFAIMTFEGWMVISEGDYVIKGVANEFYPCKESIFAKTYEAIDE